MKNKIKNQTISIGNKNIGKDYPTFIIAEAGINHNGNMDLAKQLIDIAVDAGVDAVKFQMRDFNSLYTGGVSNNFQNEDIGTQYIVSAIKQASLSFDQFKELVDYARSKNIIFMCTPWDKKSVDDLEKLGIEAYKIASADLVNIEMLEHVISKNKPIIVSTGMSSYEEIKTSVDFLEKNNAKYVILHCNSTYPAAAKDINLKFMQRLEKDFNCTVGYSGHELGISISLAAVALGAKVIERHITVDRALSGPDHAISLEKQEVTRLVRDIRRIEEAIGTDKKFITSGEFINRKILGKSLVATQNIKKGQKILKEMITSKSPAKGLSPQKINELIGKITKVDIKKGDYFTEADLGIATTKRNFNSKMKWGLIARPHDLDKIMENGHIPLVEFHFSSRDFDYPFEIKNYPDTELSVHIPELWGTELLDLCSRDKKQLQNSIDNVNRSLDYAREVKKHFKNKDSKIIAVLHAGGMSYHGFVDQKEKEKMYNILASSLKELNTDGVELLLENLPPFPWYKGGQWFSNVFMDADEIYDFAKKNKYNICYDVSHAQLYSNYKKIDPVEFLKKISPFVKHVHISDGAGVDGEGLQIGDGDAPIKKLIPIIKKIKASFVPEIWMGHQFNGEGFWTALNILKKYGL
ncbi:MAG: N-acetylneuraminate synthase family protein [Candidatus Paceibacterota bacterium]|jgi:N-acetylneuraminate synthase